MGAEYLRLFSEHNAHAVHESRCSAGNRAPNWAFPAGAAQKFSPLVRRNDYYLSTYIAQSYIVTPA